jgi:hypothetical protein
MHVRLQGDNTTLQRGCKGRGSHDGSRDLLLEYFQALAEGLHGPHDRCQLFCNALCCDHGSLPHGTYFRQNAGGDSIHTSRA